MLFLAVFLTLFLYASTGTNTQNKGVHVEANTLDWASAEKFCSDHKGHLASVHNAFDMTLLRSLAGSENCDSFWIGAKYDGAGSWSDGTKFDYQNWAPGQPSQGQCVSANTKTGKWSTNECNQKSCFSCLQNDVMTDCEDWFQAGYTDSGDYSIVLNDVANDVQCEMENGGGWTVFQRRSSGDYEFWSKTWNEYKEGFSADKQNFWLGNDLIHQLTDKDKNVTMFVELVGDRTPNTNTPNTYWWGEFIEFRVSDEASNYTLNVETAGSWPNLVGNASTGWYDLTTSSGSPFSTVDRINDPKKECVTDYHLGGWWLYNCAFASLNGQYVPDGWKDGYGMFWLVDGLDIIIHPRETAMMLRRPRADKGNASNVLE